MSISNTDPRMQELAELLRQRVAIIADHALRDQDPQAHLDALRAISEHINRIHEAFEGNLPPRLEHFMKGCSYQKALHFLEDFCGD